jgi:hypothetical protein
LCERDVCGCAETDLAGTVVDKHCGDRAAAAAGGGVGEIEESKPRFRRRQSVGNLTKKKCTDTHTSGTQRSVAVG